MASEPLANVVIEIRNVRLEVMLEGKKHTEIIPMLEIAWRCLEKQPPQVKVACDYLVEAEKLLASQGYHELAETLGELLDRPIMRFD